VIEKEMKDYEVENGRRRRASKSPSDLLYNEALCCFLEKFLHELPISKRVLSRLHMTHSGRPEHLLTKEALVKLATSLCGLCEARVNLGLGEECIVVRDKRFAGGRDLILPE